MGLNRVNATRSLTSCRFRSLDDIVSSTLGSTRLLHVLPNSLSSPIPGLSLSPRSTGSTLVRGPIGPLMDGLAFASLVPPSWLSVGAIIREKKPDSLPSLPPIPPRLPARDAEADVEVPAKLGDVGDAPVSCGLTTWEGICAELPALDRPGRVALDLD
jgi:hypothetical protein